MESLGQQTAPSPLEERAETSRFQLDYDAWHAHIAGTASLDERERGVPHQPESGVVRTRPDDLVVVERPAA